MDLITLLLLLGLTGGGVPLVYFCLVFVWPSVKLLLRVQQPVTNSSSSSSVSLALTETQGENRAAHFCHSAERHSAVVALALAEAYRE